MTPLAAAGVAMASGLVAALAFTPVARWLAHRAGVVYIPAIDRWSRRPTALLGGVAIAMACLVGVLAGHLALGNASGVPGGLVSAPSLGVAGAAVAMFAVGLADDVWHLRPQVKFVLQLLAGVLLLVMGAVVQLTPWFVVNAVVTLLWFVAVTNAFNLLDNMDGVSAGVAAIAALFLGTAFLRADADVAVVAAWALSGAAFGFLAYNFHPASIFMGDAGSLFVGALLAGLVVSSPNATSGSLVSVMFVPLAIVAVPVLDTLLVTVTRTLAGRGIAQGGRDHSTHRLVALGLSERQVAVLLYAFAVAGGLVAMALTGVARDAGLIMGTIFLVMMALLAAYLGQLHVEHPNESRGVRQVTVLMTKLLYKRRLAEILLDVILVSTAYYSAYRLRFDGSPPGAYADAFESTLGLVVAGKILLFALFGVYRGTWEYASVTDLFRIAGAVLVGAVVLYLVGPALLDPLAQSHSIIYIDALCTGALMLGSRGSFRALELVRSRFLRNGETAIIYGAGDAGELALRELDNNPALKLQAACFLDDDPRKHGKHIHGVPVAGGIEHMALAVEKYGARVVVIGTSKLLPHTREALHRFATGERVRLVELDLRFRPLAADAGEPRAVRGTDARTSKAGAVRAVGA